MMSWAFDTAEMAATTSSVVILRPVLCQW